MKLKRVLSALFGILMLLTCLTGICVASTPSEDESLRMVGASVRTTGVQGLRFVGEISKEYALTTGADANFGILLLPQTMVGANEQITVETAEVSIVPAKKLLEESDDFCRFSAVLTDIPAEYYGTEILARAYVIVNGVYQYSEQISRSVKSVADLILSSEQATEDEITVARRILAIYDEVGNDILVNANGIWNPMLRIPQVVEDFSLAPNEYYLKVENGSVKIGVFNESIDAAVNGAMALWGENKLNLTEGYFQKETFAIETVSYSDLSSTFKVYGGTAKDPLTYNMGDTVEFRLACYSGETLVTVPYIKYEIYNEVSGTKTSGYASVVSGVATVSVSNTSQSGAIYLDAVACDSSKQPLSSGVTMIDEYHFRGAAIIDRAGISMSGAVPSDFDSFWNAQVESLYSEDIEILEMKEKTSGKSGFKLFYVELKCNVYDGETDGIVSGYLTYPTSASQSSKIDLRVAFKGYSFSASEPSYQEGTATFSVCAHSIDCEQANSDSDYLTAQASKNTIFDKTANSDKETAYFRGMILRDLQAARFMVEYFGEKGIGDGKGKGMWNNINFTATGASQGAFQSIAVAALDKNITYLNISIPWMCNIKPTNYNKKSDFIMDYTAALEYYDTTSFAHLVTCKTRISASLGDDIAPVSGVVAFYNALTCERILVCSQNASHSAWLQPTDYEIGNAAGN